jgi:hypothetical protein
MNPESPRRTRPVALVVVTLATVVAGCGASHGPAHAHSASPPAPASTAIRADAEAICAKANGELTTHGPPGLPARTRIMTANASLERRAAQELSSLAVPASLRASWAVIVRDRRLLAAQLDEFATAQSRGETVYAQSLLRSKEALRRELLKAAGAAGFTQCARVG